AHFRRQRCDGLVRVRGAGWNGNEAEGSSARDDRQRLVRVHHDLVTTRMELVGDAHAEDRFAERSVLGSDEEVGPPAHTPFPRALRTAACSGMSTPCVTRAASAARRPCGVPMSRKRPLANET